MSQGSPDAGTGKSSTTLVDLPPSKTVTEATRQGFFPDLLEYVQKKGAPEARYFAG